MGSQMNGAATPGVPVAVKVSGRKSKLQPQLDCGRNESGGRFGPAKSVWQKPRGTHETRRSCYEKRNKAVEAIFQAHFNISDIDYRRA